MYWHRVKLIAKRQAQLLSGMLFGGTLISASTLHHAVVSRVYRGVVFGVGEGINDQIAIAVRIGVVLQRITPVVEGFM